MIMAKQGAKPTLQMRPPKARRERVLMCKVRMDGGCQDISRVDGGKDKAHLKTVMTGYEQQNRIPEVQLAYDGEWYWPHDGHYRLEAMKILGVTEFEADVVDGSREQARIWACGANEGQNSKSRTRDDLRASIAWLVRRYPKWPDTQIATACRTKDRKLISETRNSLGLASASCNASQDAPHGQQTRTVTRGGKTFRMNVGAIGHGGAVLPGGSGGDDILERHDPNERLGAIGQAGDADDGEDDDLEEEDEAPGKPTPSTPPDPTPARSAPPPDKPPKSPAGGKTGAVAPGPVLITIAIDPTEIDLAKIDSAARRAGCNRERIITDTLRRCWRVKPAPRQKGGK